MVKKILLYFNTIRHLKFSQIFSRILKIFKIKKTYSLEEAKEISRPDEWKFNEIYDKKIQDNKAFFLNEECNLSFHEADEISKKSKLWQYNLHYLNDLISHGSSESSSQSNYLLEHWIKNNKNMKSLGWDPYPLSIRIVNIIKFWLNGNELSKDIWRSINLQAHELSINLETDILANHYFANLKALIFAGRALNNKSFIQIAYKNIFSELEEQILDDGMNFELSPMYHALMVIDLLDLYNLERCFNDKYSNKLLSKLDNLIPKTFSAYEIMLHGDNGLSFFNDSVNGIAPSKKNINDYARSLGFFLTESTRKESRIYDLQDSGYYVLENDGLKVIFDAGEVGPKYQPGHAHADTLSLEMSYRDQRVFVNSGISLYEPGEKRDFQRSTRSHSTVEVNRISSSQVWNSFRVANRADIHERKIINNINNRKLKVTASHSGYSTLLNQCIHKRTISLGESSFKIYDQIIGKHECAHARLYLHPETNVELNDGELKITAENLTLKASVDKLHTKIIASEYYPEFGKCLKSKCIIFDIIKGECKVNFLYIKKD